MLENTHIFIDFDSTLTKVEGLDELANIAFAGNPQRAEIAAEIARLTDLGMSGAISFGESLRRRVRLLNANRNHIAELAEFLQTQISDSFLRNAAFLRENQHRIYIISGGFEEFILPVTNRLGILENHVFANNFVFDERGDIIGIDEKNPLANDKGKIKILQTLDLPGKIFVIGDGFTDYELRASNLASRFYAFVENVERANVVRVADSVVKSFDEFIQDVSSFKR